ncbi:BamA/TamA family outer membrane protein [Hymenobacter sp. ISL-91]|uniref:translocation and assembly module lipoprotein TamL n=1 Tax=Hymenobacter sp. ISL-91 TaxID=2819151 RepID=UPI001BE53794|nr:BamA/TamA family outer membrane protein [Hymenobacter sp. ISL-91]MBT2558795.1 BamA/TamA family outer membrane protein [Hymenobacter sp. ISL-91]
MFSRFTRSGRRLVAGLLLAGLAGCSGLKFIPDDARLYTGSTVTLKSNTGTPIPNEAAVQTQLEAVISPQPNASILGMRPKLYFWHMGVGKMKGLGHWLANKYGEEPVLFSEVDTARVATLMLNRLNNDGFFKPEVRSNIKLEARTAAVDYEARVNQVYRIKEIFFPERDTLLDRDIRATQAGSLLKVGDPYDLQTFVNERIRIDNELKNKGYYYFAPDYLLFQVDSTLDNQVNVYLKVKGSIPANAAQPYVLNRVVLDTDYTLQDTTMNETPIRYQGYRYYPDESMFKAKAITNAVFLYPDSLYRRRRADQTLSRLMSLGTFRFVDQQFRPARNKPDSLQYGFLNAIVRMTQVPKKSIRAEVQMNVSNLFVGPGVLVQYRNRSALRGAEQLLINAKASVETGQGEALSGVTSTQYGIDAQLLVPRLITPPFNFRLLNSDFQPRTFFEAGVKYVDRTKFFTQQVFNAGYGYTWKTKLTNEQRLQPIDLQYVRLSNTQPVFENLLNKRPFLKQSFRQQFILGSSYTYTYNQQVLEQRRNQIYFSGGVELSGNLAYLLKSLSGAAKEPEGDQQVYKIGGQQFSQYSKVNLEFRNYYRTSSNPTSGNKIAGRLLIGAGLPYLNSRVLPYFKQYGIGGPNSVRAFAARGVGPGTYRVPLENSNGGFYDQVGDIRLEGNLEYRHDLFPYVKGAVFIDAGNIWLVNPDASRPTFDSSGKPDGKNGQFQFNSFFKELAVGAGVGIRIDVQFFVIRLDAAIPIRYPYANTDGQFSVDPTIPAPPGKVFTFEKSLTGIGAYRLNIGIGYPF